MRSLASHEKIRQSQGLTQEKLAERAGMHFTYIGQIERGLRNPSLVNLQKLARALKVKAENFCPSKPGYSLILSG